MIKTFKRVRMKFRAKKSIIEFIQRAQQAGLIVAELDRVQLMMNIANLCIFHVVSLPLQEHLKDITGEPAPVPAQAQHQIVKLVLHGALVPQEGGKP